MILVERFHVERPVSENAVNKKWARFNDVPVPTQAMAEGLIELEIRRCQLYGKGGEVIKRENYRIVKTTTEVVA